jgi:glycosyltransferase involved in cell wall biosynthesis
MPEEWDPLVTALVPTYNGADFITRTLDSLAAQTWPNLEILIGDDRSTDDTLEVVRRFAAGHPNTRILERDENLGWLRNSNDLMARAEGELMFFAFHDDVVAPTYVEELVAALGSNERAVLSFSDMHVYEVDGRRSLEVFDELEGLRSSVERGRVMARRPGSWWVPNRGLFRSSAFAAVGGIHPNEQGEYSADWTWLLGLSLIGEFVRVPRVLCTKYYTPGSLSKRWPHDGQQVLALRRSGIAEIRRSRLNRVEKALLTSYLRRRMLGARLPNRVKRVLHRLGL